MTLQANTRLGPYEILTLLGVGGMGEVYRARDTRLHRDVAIKILPPAVAEHPTRRARFAREAKSISQLSHPNICTIYDVGEESGIAFFVMEYIEGESLDKRLRRGPLPCATALEWAIQIADAIDAAHRRGLVHRDLKPGNIMVAESGMKLLDFGLAKLLESTDAPAVEMPTQSITSEQKLLGTLNYMSPEQLEGREVDARTDMFAFGVTLYEMVSGRKAFDGASAASVSAAILTSEPAPISWSAAGDNVVPPGFEHIIRRAIAKHPDERWQTARDLMLELRWLKEGRSRTATVASVPHGPRWLTLAAIGVALALIAGTIGWRLGVGAQAPLKPSPIVFTIGAPPGVQLNPGSVAVSPDGRKIAFVAGPEGGTKLVWWQPLDSTVARVLPGTEGGRKPFWSPDSNSVGFYGDQQLERVEIHGGRPTVITRSESRWLGAVEMAVWAPDDTITYEQPGGGLFRVKATGGAPPVSLSIDGGMPRTLPGDRLLYLVGHTRSDAGLKIQGPGLAAPVALPVKSNAVFAAGHLVFRLGESLVAQPFDLQSLRLTGSPTTIVERVGYNPAGGRTMFDVSEDLLAYRSGNPRKLTWYQRDGRVRGSIGQQEDMNPAIAGDGSLRVAVDRWDSGANTFQVVTIDEQNRSTPISTVGTRQRWATWSPDGKWIVHMLANAGLAELRRQSSDGKGEGEVLLRRSGRLTPMDYSADGRFLVFQAGVLGISRPGEPDDGDDLWALPLLGEDKRPKRITNTPTIQETSARLSQDVRWIAYSADEGGQANIWVQEFSSGASKRQISLKGGGMDPSWSTDGKELFYVRLDGMLMAAPVTHGLTLVIGTPVELFKFDPGGIGTPLHLYAASPDGKRFLVSEVSGSPDVITLIVHWTSLLR